MTAVTAAGYGVAALMLGVAAVLAYLFYRDFFASDTFPLEWNLLLAGMAGLVLSFGGRAVGAVRPEIPFIVPASHVFLILGSVLLAVAGFILWDKFRL